ncbi:hypothetical protein M8D79_004295 [Salmonella enterica]|nr:hypothetical protein [Salmonella enterica]EDV2893547.1 hypothetical protein [Salmonella enterica subsp. diarizonae]EJF2534812.1 hypothetical protein [Salmonella enterica]
MLEKDYQLAAYKNLVAAGGLKTPDAIATSTNCAAEAKNLSDQLAGLVLETVTYPDTIASNVITITGTADTMNSTSQMAKEHADLLAANADLSVLLQLNIGWDVYCRANTLEASELPISVAIGDNVTPKTLLDSINALDIDAVVTAMTEINQVLNTGAGGDTGSGATQPTPSLTRDQIDALVAACESLMASVSNLAAPRDALKALFDKAGRSVSTSMQVYSNAINTALAEASANNTSTTSAAVALVPKSVMDELKKYRTDI